MESKRTYHRKSIEVAIFAMGMVAALPFTALATPEIFVAWGLPGTPVDPENYHVDDSDPNFPDIELITGDTNWRVWSRDDVTGAVSDIGDITA